MRDRLVRAGWTRAHVIAAAIGLAVAVGIFVAFLLALSRSAH